MAAVESVPWVPWTGCAEWDLGKDPPGYHRSEQPYVYSKEYR